MITGKYQRVRKPFDCFGAGAYARKLHPVPIGALAFRFTGPAFVWSGALYTSGYRVCVDCARRMGAQAPTVAAS